MLVAQAWYFTFFASLACLHPYLNLLFRRRAGLSEAQIGLVSCLRPWVGVASGGLWAGLADKARAHRAVLLFTFVGSTAARLGVGASHSFSGVLVPVLLCESLAAPVTIISDAAVTAACDEGEYGRQRLWGAVGWGSMALLAGTAVGAYGLGAAFVLHGLLALAVLPPSAMLPLGPLHARLGERPAVPPSDGEFATDKGGGSCGNSSAQRGSLDLLERERLFDGFPAMTGGHPVRPLPPAGAPDGQEEGRQLPKGLPPASKQVAFMAGISQLLREPEVVVFFFMAAAVGYGVGKRAVFFLPR
jgi:hypothetical protein